MTAAYKVECSVRFYKDQIKNKLYNFNGGLLIYRDVSDYMCI